MASQSKRIGGILLVIGTTIGGAILALPTVSAEAGFAWSSLQLIFAWVLMGLGSLLLLEISATLPPGSNMITMAQSTLGRAGSFITWICYFLLLYSLVAAYIASGSEIFHTIGQYLGFFSTPFIYPLLFTVLLGSFVYRGIGSVDLLNRALMSLKFIGYFVLVALIFSHAKVKQLPHGPAHALLPALPVMMTSFGFGSIIPTLREYFDDDLKSLRYVILLGSGIPLVLYLLWNFAVLGSVSNLLLTELLHSSKAVTAIAEALSHSFDNPLIRQIAHLFTSICVATSFLSVSIGLFDFIADAFRWKKQGIQKQYVAATTFLPPLLLVAFYPKAFITALDYAGTLCLILLILLPVLMTWSARYRLQWRSDLTLSGGKPLLALIFLCSILCIAISIMVDLHRI